MKKKNYNLMEKLITTLTNKNKIKQKNIFYNSIWKIVLDILNILCNYIYKGEKSMGVATYIVSFWPVEEPPFIFFATGKKTIGQK